MRDGDRVHACGLSGDYAVVCVFDDEAAFRFDIRTLSCEHEQIGVRLRAISTYVIASDDYRESLD